MKMPFSLNQLQYIVAVNTYKHFVKAADSCFVSQPTLSMQIQKMEKQLGIEIFDRSKKPIEPTDIGKIVIQQATIILQEASSIEVLIQQTQNQYSGTLMLGILPTLAPYVMPLMIHSFQSSYPNIILRVQELTTAHIMQGIQDGTLDAGVIATSENMSNLEEIYLFEEKFINFVSPKHPFHEVDTVTHTELELKDIWLLSDGHCFRDQVLNLCRSDLNPIHEDAFRQPHFECGYFDTLIRMVEVVDGFTLLPELALPFLTEPQKKLLRPFSDNAPTRTIRLVGRSSFLKKPLLNAFATTVKEEVQPYVYKVYEDPAL